MSFLKKALGLGAGGLIPSSIIAGGEAKKAARSAAEVQAQAAESAIEEQRRQFDITQGQLEPFREAGVGALEQQQALLGLLGQEQQQQAFTAFVDSPGQQFLRERGQRNLLRNASAIGGLGGGNVRSALVQQGVGFAQQDFQNQLNRLAELSGTGQTAATSVGQFGARVSGGIANLLGMQGQARASGILGAKQAGAQQQQQLFQMAGSALGFLSDKRLKNNIEKVGEFNEINWYTWTWNSLANSLGLFGDDSGVIADEVKKIKPHLIGEIDGYLTVNYSGLGV